MKSSKLKTLNLRNKKVFTILPIIVLALTLVVSFVWNSKIISAQENTPKINLAPSIFRIGEKFTYNISFEKFSNAGYAEMSVISRGQLSGKDAVELGSKLKTNDLVSAAFYSFDETRSTFVSADTGLPLYLRKISNSGILPKETINNYLNSPSSGFDLLSVVYQIRNNGGNGNFTISEDEKIYSINSLLAGNEKVTTDAGIFDTSISNVQSEYFTEKGLTEFSINFSNDERKIPVLFRFKTAKGEFRANLASFQLGSEEMIPVSTPTPVPTPTPLPTPKPIPTPTPVIENQPLLKELPFELGETLEYQISQGGQSIGNIKLQATERKLFNTEDSLLLTAIVTNSKQGNPIFRINDSIKANVNPDTLAPQKIEIKFTGTLASFNQTTLFDQKIGAIFFNGTNKLDVPVGTHSLLSLIYAVRSFNLKPSKNPNNPVNDTRVAVFWDNQPYVFTLRPANAEIINLRGEKISAQLISINTGNPQLDQLGLRIWLGNDDQRIPLRFSAGSFQADFVSESKIQPK